MRIRQYWARTRTIFSIRPCDIIKWFLRNCKILCYEKNLPQKKTPKTKRKQHTETIYPGVDLHVRALYYMNAIINLYKYFFSFKQWLPFLTSRFFFSNTVFFLYFCFIFFYVNKLVRVFFVCFFFLFTCSFRVKLATSWNSNP